MMVNIITFFGQKAKIACDEKCEKAWGLNSRPIVDEEYLTDDQLGVAPVDPGTIEGADKKPIFDEDKLNKWCVRECERCNLGRAI